MSNTTNTCNKSFSILLFNQDKDNKEIINTIGDLKKFLSNFDDNTAVLIDTHDNTQPKTLNYSFRGGGLDIKPSNGNKSDCVRNCYNHLKDKKDIGFYLVLGVNN